MAADPSTESRAQYLSEPVQVALAVQSALIAAWPEPHTIASLQAHTERSRDQVYRALVNLAAAGVAEEVSAGWMIGPAITVASERIRVRTARLLARYLGGEA